jgi:hypothetical protein
MERLMSKVQLAALGLVGLLVMAPLAQAQKGMAGRPYIGYVYPAGGQQGTTFQVKLGGQGLDGISDVVVSGKGVRAKVVDYLRKLGPQDMVLLSEQMKLLKKAMRGSALASVIAPAASLETNTMDSMMDAGAASGKSQVAGAGYTPALILARLQHRTAEYVRRPACASIASLAYVEVTMAADARPGVREFSVVTTRGVSNPLVFHVGQLPERSRKPMLTSHFQVLGKEELSQRKRPDEEIEDRITVPCTVNGQVATGEVNRYRFEARAGQRLVLSTAARELVPYIADAVPGWFQPVLTLYDADGKEVAYSDDYRFKPDPVIFYKVPKDGEYVFEIRDALYRGREDFVYRVTVGELPMLTSVFPLGGRVGEVGKIKPKGWNLQGAQLAPPAPDAKPGVYRVTASREGVVSNAIPFALDRLPECLDQEPNNTPEHAQPVKMPMIVNGRIDRADDWDVFEVAGRAGETLVAEVYARRLDSPLDSVLKVTDASGTLLGFNDDCEDLGAGVNTHDADSYVRVKLPADGKYYVHLGDTARNGGEVYAYRLRLSKPRPDFALRVVPSTVSMRSHGTAAVSVYVIRKDGFSGPIKLGLKEPPAGFSASPVTLTGNQAVTRLAIRTDLVDTQQPVGLVVEGRAKSGDQKIARNAVPAEDRMQAFLWRHLVPTQELKALVFNPSRELPAKRARQTPEPTYAKAAPTVASASAPGEKPKFSKQQVAGRLRRLKLLFEDGLFTEGFYDEKVAECEAAR